MAACRSCAAEVIWVKLLPRGRLAPLDATRSAEGNIRMLGTRNAIARVLSKENLAKARAAGDELYTSHFATCPNAKSHRKRHA